MTQTEKESLTERFIHAAFEEAGPVREALELPEHVEDANAIALALLDLAADLWSRREGWEHPIYQHCARSWWRDHAALPVTQMLAVGNALHMNGMHEPPLYWK